MKGKRRKNDFQFHPSVYYFKSFHNLQFFLLLLPDFLFPLHFSLSLFLFPSLSLCFSISASLSVFSASLSLPERRVPSHTQLWKGTLQFFHSLFVRFQHCLISVSVYLSWLFFPVIVSRMSIKLDMILWSWSLIDGHNKPSSPRSVPSLLQSRPLSPVFL